MYHCAAHKYAYVVVEKQGFITYIKVDPHKKNF